MTSLGPVFAQDTPATAPAREGGIVTVAAQPLTAPDGWTTPGHSAEKILSPEQAQRLWAGSTASVLRPLLTGEQAFTGLSPELETLLRQVLATGARGPIGGETDAGLLAGRIQGLIRLGDLEAASQILSRTPRVGDSSALSQARADLQFLRGDTAGACDTAQMVQDNRNGRNWLKIRALCHVLNGDKPAAELALGLYQQAGPATNSFDGLMAYALFGGKTKPQASARDAAELALSRHLALDLSAAVRDAPLPMLVSLSAEKDLSPSARVRLMRTLYAHDLVSVDTLRSVLWPEIAASAGAEAPVAPKPVSLSAKAWAALAKDRTAAGEARLWDVLRAGKDLKQRETALALLVDRAGPGSARRQLLRLAHPELKSLADQSESLSQPLRLATWLAVAGDLTRAQTVRSAMKTDPSAEDVLNYDAIRALSGPEPVSATLVAQAADLAGTLAGKARSRVQGVALILAATRGLKGEGRNGLDILGADAPALGTGQILALQAAISDQAVGEVALRVAEAYATRAKPGRKLSEADAAILISALKAAGFEAQSKAFAMSDVLSR
ncbi:MAG: hypothetical protein ACK41P_07825 [Asticcacaulis sp.]